LRRRLSGGAEAFGTGVCGAPRGWGRGHDSNLRRGEDSDFVRHAEARARADFAHGRVFGESVASGGEGRAALGQVSVSSHKGALAVKTAGIVLRVNKAHLRVDAFDADGKTPLTLESPGDGRVGIRRRGACGKAG